MGLERIVSIEPGSVLWTIVTFLIVVWLIAKLGWKPLLSGLRTREESIRKDLETAKTEREEAAQLLSKYQETISDAKKEAADIIQGARDSAVKIREEGMEQTRRDSEKMISRAKTEIERESQAAKKELQMHVADLTAKAASRLLGRTIDAKEHEQLILEALREDK